MYIPKLHKIWLCQNDKGGIYMYPKMANRHGLIAGATGTGKTVTLKVLAESFSEMGVPVFLADIKGDVSGMCLPGEDSEGFRKRLRNKLGLETEWKFAGYPVRFWDVYGKGGIPVRATVSEMGPDLLSRLLELNDTQSGVMNIVFRVADDQGLLLLDFKDLRSMVQYVGDNAAQFKTSYGNITPASIGAIQRALLRLEDHGADIFFGEPALDIKDWFATAEDGRGVINLLHATELFQRPLLYSTFLLWMLSELYEMMPEAGDLDKPKMVFFFDEAHLIFRMHRNPFWIRLNRLSASSVPRASVFTLSPNSLQTYPKAYWHSSATSCSMHCAPTLLRNARALKLPRNHSAKTRH